MYSVHSIVYIVQCTLYNAHCKVYSVYSIKFIVCVFSQLIWLILHFNIHWILHLIRCMIYFCSIYCVFIYLNSVFNSLYSMFCMKLQCTVLNNALCSVFSSQYTIYRAYLLYTSNIQMAPLSHIPQWVAFIDQMVFF